MATQLFKSARPPACFAPSLTADDIPALRETLKNAGKNGLKPFEPVVNTHPELMDTVKAVLNDKAGKFDQLAKDIATQYLTSEQVDIAVFPPMYDALAAMATKFFETPSSTEKPTIVPVYARMNGTLIGEIPLTPLTESETKRIWDLVPWYEEIEMWRLASSCLPSGTKVEQKEGENPKVVVVNQEEFDIKNASQHLIWYAHELYLDREPTTKERALKS